MTSNKKELLLEMKNIHINGFSDERWHKILKGVDLKLHRGGTYNNIARKKTLHVNLKTIEKR